MKVKICGIKKIEDAMAAVEYGADAVGMIVGKKHIKEKFTGGDFIDKELAKCIVDKLPPFCSSVIVVCFEDVNNIIFLANYIGATTLQLHNDSKPEDILFIKKKIPYIKIIKLLNITDEQTMDVEDSYLDVVDAILLDTIDKKNCKIGGTGKTHDWNISQKIVASYKKPVILAGGLNLNNVQFAIKKVKPFGVDVNSGTKGEDGFKDRNKLKEFIRKAKNTL